MKQLLSTLAFVAILAACTSKPKEVEQKCAKDSTCTKMDSTCKQKDATCAAKEAGCCKKADTTEYSKIIAAKIYVKPEKITEFTKFFKGMIDSTVKEPGCTGYQLFQNPYDKNSFLVFETYKNQAAIDAHFAASYFKMFSEKIGNLTSKPNEIAIYDIAGEKKN